MTDNEIIKALECCSVALMYDEEQNLYRLALSLINRQKAEIERLSKKLPLKYIEGGRDAIKQFLEKVKERSEFEYEFFLCSVLGSVLDEVAKEMGAKVDEGEGISESGGEIGCHHSE